MSRGIFLFLLLHWINVAYVNTCLIDNECGGNSLFFNLNLKWNFNFVVVFVEIVIYPEIAYVKSGDELEFYCTFSKKCMRDKNISISNVYFTHNNEELESKYLKIIDNYNVRFKISNATLDHNGRYFCKIRKSPENQSEALCLSVAKVGCKCNNLFF